MRIGIIQPPYPGVVPGCTAEDSIEFILREIEATKEPLDLLVLPEYSNCPGASTKGQIESFLKRASGGFMDRLSESAAERRMIIAANTVLRQGELLYNATILLGRDGAELAMYRKAHLTPTELHELGISPGGGPVTIEVEGVRIGFLTCFDAYFAEYAEAAAAQRPDMIIFASYQRSEDMNVIRRQAAARALDMEAFIVRASYSMGEGSPTGGTSLIATPSGEIVLDAGQGSGLFVCSINPKQKRQRPVAHGMPEATSRQIVEDARRPGIYRASRRPELAPYPRVVAHRGLSGLCPENTIPAFGAAIALGADEIEFDIWGSKDRELIICHDCDVARTTNGSGRIPDLTWDEISKLDAGIRFSPDWANIPMPRFRDILERFAGQVVMNMHVQEPGEGGWMVREIGDMVREFGIEDQVYVAGERGVLQAAMENYPEIERCSLEGQIDMTLVDHAIEFKCRRVQFFDPYFNNELIQRARDLGLTCNLYHVETPEEAKERLAQGIDAILTDHANLILPITRA